MSRYHWWGFIVNEAGEPIENAEIRVKLAGSEEMANVYYDEFGNSNSADTPALSAGPQLSTLSNGYYEFWIGDISEPYGYRNEQKFKIEWIRIGVAAGEVDYVNVFPLGPQIEQMSITNCVSPSTQRNKMISDYYACKWDTHTDATVVLPNNDFSPVHGLDFVNVNELDTVPNKIINNFYGWQWDHHRLSTVQDYHPSGGSPHGLEEVNPYDGSSTLRNKVVSNYDLFNLQANIDTLSVVSSAGDAYLQWEIDQLTLETDTSRAGWWNIFGNEWIEDALGVWYVDIAHDMNIWYPFVVVYETLTNQIIMNTNIEYINTNTVRISIENQDTVNPPDLALVVRIGSGGIQRFPEITP